jgi:SAM-dependent methyltransferase
LRPGDPPRYDALLQDLGDLDPFADPAEYDLQYAERTEDVDFYRELLSDAGTVLEVGCGNGRILLPLARAGVDVAGVDRSSGLIRDLRERIRAEGLAARVHQGDMRSFRLRRRFDRVLCAFNTFLHLYRRVDVERFLARVRAHLAPGGQLVFDALVPRPADLARDPDRWLSAGILRDREGRRWVHRERFAYEPLEQILYVTSEQREHRGDGARTRLLAHRQFYPAELEALLHYNGFAIEHVWADFRREEPELDADSLVWVCRPTR